MGVSTHSRPKAAGSQSHPIDSPRTSFNTQPPEGGWYIIKGMGWLDKWFQHTAARRRLVFQFFILNIHIIVSTHSRPKAAGVLPNAVSLVTLFQHTAARRRLVRHNVLVPIIKVFQHTAARRRLVNGYPGKTTMIMFQHTAARRRLVLQKHGISAPAKFQHTAARRRLDVI